MSKCKGCGASVKRWIAQCPYCGAFSPGQRDTPSEPGALPRLMGEFGLRSHGLLFVLLLLAAPASVGVWQLERPGTYWSSDLACAGWLGGVPFWLMLVAIFWRPRATRWVGAALSFFLCAAPFVTMVAIRGKRLNDDAWGLAAAVGACGMGGFILGWLLHGLIRRTRARLEMESARSGA